MNESSPSIPLDSLSDEELDASLRQLRQHGGQKPRDSDQREHHIEIELQNRALREMQAALEQAVHRYADLYDNLPLPYVTVKPSGEVVSANAAATEWLQRERSALIGSSLSRYFDVYDGGRFTAHVASCLQADRLGTMDLVLRLPDGSSVPAQLATRRAASTAGGLPTLHIAITDLSKVKQSQGVMAEMKREHDAFSHSISHDLRAPLVTIHNYASIVLSDFGATLTPQVQNMVERIRVASRRMEDTLKGLLDYSSIAHAQVTMHSLNLDELVTHLLVEHRALIEARNADILVDRPLPAIRGVRELVDKILVPILANALEYTAPGETPKVRIFAELVDSTVILKIADQGIGIDPKYYDRIFEPFERLHGQSRYPGSGLGLAIARRATERMQGRIWCESLPERGCCFCVALPRS